MKNLTRLLVLILLSVSLTSCQTNQSTDVVVTNKLIDSLMTHCNEHGMFNGTILVSENNKVIYKNALGMADFEADLPLTTETQFYLASVSKQFTTMAVMLLKEDGLLSYDDTLADYFPEFPDYAKTVTIRHMMNHTSGIPDHYGLNAYKKGLTNDDVLELLVQQENLQFEPGEKYSYSNGGYVLLSMIVANVANTSFAEFMKARIFDPLNMNNTLVFDETTPALSNRASGYNGMNQLDDYEIFTTGAGGMFSNITDLFKWEQALYTEKLVSHKTLQEAYTPTTLNDGTESTYGFGWGINFTDTRKVVEHSGGMNGFRTYLRRYIDKGNAYILLTNNGSAVGMGEINQALDNILSGQEFTIPKIPISTALSKALSTVDSETAIANIKLLYQEQPDNYKMDEDNLNALGYGLLNNDSLTSALNVFAFNIEMHPNSSNVYDSYAEGLLKKGDTLLSIENYKKSVLLNPNNTNGIEVLQKLGLSEEDILPTITLSTELLDSYVGKYQLNANMTLAISREGDQLFIWPTGQSKSKIFPASESRFFSKIVNAQITFNSDENGNVSSLTLHQSGDHPAKRIE